MPRYLVIQLARFGDVVQTKRLVRTLCLRGETHVCVDRGLRPLASILYPEAVVHPLPAHGNMDASAMESVHATLRELAALPFDAVYNCNYSGLNHALARLFPTEIVRGYRMRGPQPLRDAWVSLAFRWTSQRRIAPINLVDFWAYFDRHPCDPTETCAPARGQGRGLGVVLAGRESRRSLPPPVLARCLHTAFEALNGPPVFFLGSAAERPLGRQLLRQLPGHMVDRVQDLSGKTDWAGLMDALTGLDAVLTPDTGTMHLAAHLGVPVQAFFLSSAWCHETGPYGSGHTVWQGVGECAPCLEAGGCGSGTACLRAFESRGLLRGLADSLQGNPPAGRLPEDLAQFASHVDALGSTWRLVAGQDTAEPRRTALRQLVAEYLHVPLTGQTPRDAALECALADFFYDEAQWMLPEDAHEC